WPAKDSPPVSGSTDRPRRPPATTSRCSASPPSTGSATPPRPAPARPAPCSPSTSRPTGQRFMALNGGPQFTFSEAISFRVDCADQAEVDHYWATLTADGGEGGPCGWLKDKYGVSWQIVPTALLDMITDPDAGKASRTLRAMLAMGKLDLAALERAYAGE
ncbi:LOW QUALITY PROTEIN: 3-demethylubiquinone-9 3-methyltransferase, partial [Streptomyces sp. e14]